MRRIYFFLQLNNKKQLNIIFIFTFIILIFTLILIARKGSFEENESIYLTKSIIINQNSSGNIKEKENSDEQITRKFVLDFSKSTEAENQLLRFGDNLTITRTKSQIEINKLIDLLPYLNKNNLKTLNSQVLINSSRILRSPPEIVFMIPSTHREGQNYLIETIQNLLKNIAEEEEQFIQIIILISENPWDLKMEENKLKITKLIFKNFEKEINKGILELIAPPIELFPPNLENIKTTLNDPPERMRWRTKQNLDYAFAMLHVFNSKPKTKYYVQLEDDIITVPGFVSQMRRFANKNSKNFFMIEFASLGFIGRMFHNNKDLLQLSHFILLLYNAIPVDWILSTVISAKFCSIDDGWPKCYKQRLLNIVIFTHQPPLFQHQGIHSSLSGKFQKLKEKNFNSKIKFPIEKSENYQTFNFSPKILFKEIEKLYFNFTPLNINLKENNQIVINYSKPIEILKGG